MQLLSTLFESQPSFSEYSIRCHFAIGAYMIAYISAQQCTTRTTLYTVLLRYTRVRVRATVHAVQECGAEHTDGRRQYTFDYLAILKIHFAWHMPNVKCNDTFELLNTTQVMCIPSIRPRQSSLFRIGLATNFIIASFGKDT